jgi:hypothetical protein
MADFRANATALSLKSSHNVGHVGGGGNGHRLGKTNLPSSRKKTTDAGRDKNNPIRRIRNNAIKRAVAPDIITV